MMIGAQFWLTPNRMFKNKDYHLTLRLPAILGMSVMLFLPMIGRGFIHDDFVHLNSAAYDSFWHGLTHANGGPFYAPVAWLTFKLDWMLWGGNAFPMAMMNLLFHLMNVFLLYHLAFRLWHSITAASWAALGFSLLFPANSWALMWISTRAHLLVTFFYLAALLTTLWFCRTDRRRGFAAITILLCAVFCLFSKESGVVIPITIALLLRYERQCRNQRNAPLAAIVGLFAALFAILVCYLGVRSQSGAVPLSFSTDATYTYTLSLKVLAENLLRYLWRTYGLLTLLAGAIGLSHLMGGRRLRFNSFAKDEALLSASLFGVTIAPFLLLRQRSGIYTYLPGVAAALLLGAFAHALKEKIS